MQAKVSELTVLLHGRDGRCRRGAMGTAHYSHPERRWVGGVAAIAGHGAMGGGLMVSPHARFE